MADVSQAQVRNLIAQKGARAERNLRKEGFNREQIKAAYDQYGDLYEGKEFGARSQSQMTRQDPRENSQSNQGTQTSNAQVNASRGSPLPAGAIGSRPGGGYIYSSQSSSQQMQSRPSPVQGPVQRGIDPSRFRNAGDSVRVQSTPKENQSSPTQTSSQNSSQSSSSGSSRFQSTPNRGSNFNPNTLRSESSSISNQSSQDLKGVNRQSTYGPSESNRVSNRVLVRPGGESRTDDSSNNFFGRLASYFKEAREKAKGETYVSGLGPTGAFVTASEDTGGRGTVIARVPTEDEYKILSNSDKKGDILDRSAGEVVRLSKSYSELTEGFDNLSAEEQQERVTEIRRIGGDVDPVTSEIIPPQVGIGFGANKRLVGIDELDARNPGQVYRSALSLLAAKKAGEVVQGQVDRFRPVTNLLFSTPQFSGNTFAGRTAMLSAAAAPGLAETLAGQSVNVAPYLIPGAGQSLFFAEQGGNLAYEVAQKGTLAGGAQSYAQKFPYELGGVAVVGVAAAARATTPVIKIVRNTETVPSKSPQIFVNPVSAKSVVTPEGNQLFEVTYNAAGRATRGAEISNVQVLQNRPILEFFGVPARVIYDSAEGGAVQTLKVAGTGSTLTAKTAYREAFDELVKRGYSKAQATSALRSYTKSPADVRISGTGNVIMGATDRDLVMASGEIRYSAAKQPMSPFKDTRGFAPFKERTSTLGASLVEKDGVQYFLTESDVVKLFYPKGSPSQEFMKLSQAGRTTRQVQQLSGVKEIGQVELGIDVGNPFGAKALQFNVFQEGSLSRQTIPARSAVIEGKSTIFVRDAGEDIARVDYGQPFKVDTIPMKPSRVPSSDVKLDERQAQDILSTLKSLYGDKVAEGGKNVAARLPKPNLGFSKAPKSGAIEVGKDIGKVDESVGLSSTTNVAAASSFFGKGQYERTELVSTPAADISPVSSMAISAPDGNFERISFSAGTVSNATQGSSSKTSDILKEPSSSLPRSRSRSNSDQGTGVSLRNDEVTKTGTESGSGVKQTPRLRQFFNQMLKVKTDLTKAPKPVKIPVRLFGFGGEDESSNAAEESSGTFKVFTRKFGKDVLLGEEESKAGAAKLLRNQLVGTLRASGFVVNPSGQRLKAADLNLGRGFKAGKRDQFRVVQARGYRLGSRGEVAEIKAARKSRPKRMKFF